MSKSNIKLISLVPGPANLRPLLDKFLADGPGVITSLSDAQLKVLKALAGAGADSVRAFGDVVGAFMTRMQGQKLLLAQAGHIQAAIAEACLLLPEDSAFFPSARFSGTHRRIATALSALRGWGMDADEMESSAERFEGDLSNKLRTLAFIERELSDTLQAISRERNSDRLAASLALTGERTDLGRLLLVAGSQIEQSIIGWIRWAAESGAQVTALFDCPQGKLFASAAESMKALGGKASHSGAPNGLQGRLFAAPADTSSGDMAGHEKNYAAIMSAPDMLSECEWVMRAILSDLDAGLIPGEVSIYCRNPGNYLPLLYASALRFEIPLSSSSRTPLLCNSFAKLVLDLLEFCASEDVRKLSRLLKSTYLALEVEQRASCEAAIKTAFAEKQRQWQTLENWVGEHEEDAAWLAPLLEWRSAYQREPASLSVWCERLRELGQQPWHEQALNGTGFTTVRDSYAQSAVQRSLAQYASVDRTKGKRPLNLPQFVRICRWVWQSAEVSSPTNPEAVSVVSSADELGDIQRLYVVGMLEGVFPRRRSEDPILTDADRAAISALRPERLPLPDSHTQARSERDEFYRICGAATDRLTLSYPQTEDDRDNVRAFYLVEVTRALKGEVDLVDHRRTELTPDQPFAGADVRLKEALMSAREEPLPNVLVSESARAAVTRTAQNKVSPRDLADVLECPFRFLADKVLKVLPNRRRSRWHSLFLLPSTTGLASLPSREAARQNLRLALEAQLSRLYADTSSNDLNLMRSGGERLLDEWLEREFSARDLWPREAIIDRPSFEKGDMRSKLKAGDGFVLLSGEGSALSERNGYRILHLFRASDPWKDSPGREEGIWDRLKEREAFELGLYLLSLSNTSSDKVGIELDSANGTRNLFIMPRPEEMFRSNQAQCFKVSVIEQDQRAALVREIARGIRTALDRMGDAVVEAVPGDHCRTCEHGELCRRSRDFGEEVDPFVGDDFE